MVMQEIALVGAVTIELLAAVSIELLIKIGIPLLIVGFSVARHLLALAAKNPAVPAEKPPTPRPRKNPDLSDEVEIFLKNVRQRQKQGGQKQGGKRQAAHDRPASSDVVVADVVEAQMVEPAPAPVLVSRGEGFDEGASLSGERVALEAEQIARLSQKLGVQIDQADERIAEQIHSTFDHQLGQFDASQATSDDATQATSKSEDRSVDMATDLRQMLTDPRDIRRAIVLNEILNPPLERW